MKTPLLFVTVVFLLSCSGGKMITRPNGISYSEKEMRVYNNEIVKYGLVDGDTLVDIGCGPGTMDELIFKFYPNSYFMLEDVDVMIFNESQYKLKVNGQKRPFIEHYRKVLGTHDTIPLPTGSYRNVLCRLALHEFTNPTKMTKELNRITAPDGKLIVVENIATHEGQKGDGCNKPLLSRQQILSTLTTGGFTLVKSDSTAYSDDEFGGNAHIFRFEKKENRSTKLTGSL